MEVCYGKDNFGRCAGFQNIAGEWLFLYRQDSIYTRMVEVRGCSHVDYASAPFWQNTEHEHGRVLFSDRYAGREDLFEGLEVWKDENLLKVQGTYPVIFLSFAGVKQNTYQATKQLINELISELFIQYDWLLKDAIFTEGDRSFYRQVSGKMDDAIAALSLNRLSGWLERYYGKKCIILLDEYDTPMQEAYVNGFWDELTAYTRALFNK